MRRILVFCLLFGILFGLSGCSLPNMSAPTAITTLVLPPVAFTKAPPAMNTLAPLPTFTKAAGVQTQAPTLPAPTKPALTATQPASATLAPTKPASTTTKPASATLAPTKPAATQALPTATVSVKEARIFMIALNDNGASGKKIGCGDSLVPVTITLPDPNAPLRGALDRLLAVRTQYYGQSGLYNTLFRSDLHIVSVTIVNSIADIKLSGSLTLGGVCDSPRVQAQLEEVALQFSTVKQVNIFVNGKRLQDLLSGK